MLCKYRIADCPTDWLMALFHSLPNWGVGPRPPPVPQLTNSVARRDHLSVTARPHYQLNCTNWQCVCISMDQCVWACERDREIDTLYPWMNLHVRACTWTMPRTADSFRLSLRSSLIASVSLFSSIFSPAPLFISTAFFSQLLSTPIHFLCILPLLFTYCLALYPSQSMSHIINTYSFSSTGQLKSTVGSSGWWPPTWKERARHRLICQCQSWL